MNQKISSFAAVTGVLAGAALLMLLTGCETDGSAQVTLYGDRPHGYGTATVMFEDDYDYYPGYEVYYSRNRREYVYRDGNAWVRRSQPSGVSLNILLSSPSVRVDFRDSPEYHHDTVVSRYPRNWNRTASSAVQVQVGVNFEDDYDYYPAQEVYYSRNRREYVYRDGNSWVRRSEPRGISVNALLSLPSVRVDFRDSPERHHSSVVRSYPRNWNRPDAKVAVRQEPRQENRQVNQQDDRRDEKVNEQERRDEKKLEKNDAKADKKNSKKHKKDRKDDDQDDRKDDHR
jgi:hypothetical protein